ncbi:MAG: hypothetical protein AAGJ35_00805, partial [Myxococcota bacterium]
LDAHVHLVIPKRQMLRNPNDPKPQPRASVLMIVSAARPPSIKESDVRRLVAGAMENLRPSNISVIFSRQRSANDDTSPGEMLIVAGLRVKAADAGKLKWILGGVGALAGLFLILFLWSFVRAASLSSRLNAIQLSTPIPDEEDA